jgi:hypothetical protein
MNYILSEFENMSARSCSTLAFEHSVVSLVSVVVLINKYDAGKCSPTGGPQATSGPRPLVTRLAKLFVNLLQITTSSFILFTAKDMRKNP